MLLIEKGAFRKNSVFVGLFIKTLTPLTHSVIVEHV